jgi:hypothetical protein
MEIGGISAMPLIFTSHQEDLAHPIRDAGGQGAPFGVG